MGLWLRRSTRHTLRGVDGLATQGRIYARSLFHRALREPSRCPGALFIIVVFGVGLLAKSVLVFVLSVFPFIFNTFAGVRSTDPLLINVVRSFGGARKDLYFKVIFPSTLPYIIAGARIALGRGLVGIIVGEFYAASEGIGFAISRFGDTYRLPEMFAGIFVLMIAAVRSDRRHEKTRSRAGAVEDKTGDAMNRLASFYSEKEAHILGAGFILLLIVLWELIPHLLTLSKGMSLFFTTPFEVIEAGYQLIVENKIQEHLYVSSIEFLLGLGLAIAVGLPVGLITGRSRILDAMVDPFIPSSMPRPGSSSCLFSSSGSGSGYGRRS